MKWDERYRSGDGESSPDPFVISATANLVPGKALDLACGLGRHAQVLAAQGWEVTAVDSSSVAISRLRDSAGRSGLRVHAILADLESGEFDIASGEYDLVCDCFYLQRSLFTQIRTGIKAGGIFLALLPLESSNSSVPPMNPDYLVHPEELPTLFADWDILHYSEGYPAGDTTRHPRAELFVRKPAA